MKKLILLLALIVTIIACKKDSLNEPNPGESQTKGDSLIIVSNTPLVKSLISVDPTSLTFLSDNNAKGKIRVGTILVSGITEKAPYGYLREVTEISEINGSLVCKTVSASLPEVIKDGELHVKQKFTSADVVSSDASGNDKRLQDGDPLRLSLPIKTRIAGIDISGSIDFEGDLNYDMVVKKSKLISASATLDAKISSRLRATSGITVKMQPKPLKIGEFQLAPKVILIDIIPVVIVPVLEVFVGAEGEVTGSVVMEATGSASVKAEISKTAETDWATTVTPQTDSKLVEMKFSSKQKVSVYTQANPQLRFYWQEDQKVAVPTTISLTASSTHPDFCTSLDWSVKVEGWILYKITGITLVDFKRVIFEKAFNIFRGLPSEFLGTFAVGDTALGGIVCYVSANGRSGLVMPMPNLWPGFNLEWWPDKAPYLTPGNFTLPKATGIGAGEANTLLLLSPGEKKPYIAGYCNDLTIGCYDDWYLPSEGELVAVYQNKAKLPAIPAYTFYSSNLVDEANAGLLITNTAVNFANGSIVKAYLTDPQFSRRIEGLRRFMPLRTF